MNPRQTLTKAQRVVHRMDFGNLMMLARAFGFRMARANGSHYIFVHPHVPELLNLQNYKSSGTAKPYHIRQLLTLVEQYALVLEGDA